MNQHLTDFGEAREEQRLHALAELDVLDTPREAAFDRITNLIRKIFGVRIALVSMVDAHRQWHLSSSGMDRCEVDKNDTFCQITINQDDPLIIQDATTDPRVCNNAYVTESPGIRFYAGVPLRSASGYNVGTLWAADTEPREFSPEEASILADFAQMAMDEIELRKIASIDSLTNILSRGAFKKEGERAIALAQRHNNMLSCIVFDLDHFKAINDTYGHAAGDQVLSGVANACRSELRGTDIFGRIGGEEFALVLPHTDESGALEAAERLRARVQGLRFEFGMKAVFVTASFGVAAWSDGIKQMDVLVANADAALYAAKAAGRNICRSWHRLGDDPKTYRRRVLKAGCIQFNNRMSTMACTVRTLSDQGAGLDVGSSVGLPNKFNLSIKSEGFAGPCRVVAQTERHIEVEFC